MASIAQLNEWLKDGPDSRFMAIYSDIADAVSSEQPFKAVDLIGRLPTIAPYTPRYQREIIGAVVKRMTSLEAPADGLTKLKAGVYQWRISDKE